MRKRIKKLITTITPYDALEQEHITDVLTWIDSGAELFRLQKPDIPPKHLVSYIVLIDKKREKLLLINHIKSQLLLPPGGHVEKDEYPTDTAKRELKEELGMEAAFINNNPFFITVTKTVNTDAGHTDVSLWYLLCGDANQALVYDKKEMSGYQWLSFTEILEMKNDQLDPHMHRFIKKIRTFII